MSEPKKTNRQRVEVPPVEALEAELGRMRRQGRRRSSARSTVFTLLIVAAIAVILTILILPVLTIQGVSMEETLFETAFTLHCSDKRRCALPRCL